MAPTSLFALAAWKVIRRAPAGRSPRLQRIPATLAGIVAVGAEWPGSSIETDSGHYKSRGVETKLRADRQSLPHPLSDFTRTVPSPEPVAEVLKDFQKVGGLVSDPFKQRYREVKNVFDTGGGPECIDGSCKEVE
jgi:hypothetical protein